jgi:hypothetical protein
MQTLLKPTHRPAAPTLRASAEPTAATGNAPCSHQTTCSAVGDPKKPAGYLLPCPMTCVSVKFQDLRWD